jgi:membrane protein implicated in regulation of membrane protease activity
MPAWLIWALLAVALTVGEILTPGMFFLGPVALAAVVAMIVSLIPGVPLWIEMVVFAAASAGSLAVLRPIARAHIKTPRAIRTGTAALEGAKAVVLQRVDDGTGGRVKLGGEEWSARSYVHDEVFDPGTEVEVAQIEGATALVYK